jgi:hypothetical protein
MSPALLTVSFLLSFACAGCTYHQSHMVQVDSIKSAPLAIDFFDHRDKLACNCIY